MFEIEEMAKAKLTDVVVLSQKNREPNDNPGAALSFDMTVTNEVLSMFDPSLRGFLYYKSAASSSDAEQGRLEVDTQDLPNLTTAGQKVGKLHWDLELAGYTLTIDYGMGGRKSDLLLNDCEASNFTFQPKEGGSVLMSFKLETQDVSEKIFGKLATLKNLEVQIKFTPPSLDDSQQGIE